jgi:hypothetical protein
MHPVSGFPWELKGAQNPGFLKKPGFSGIFVVSSGAWLLKMMSWRQPTWKTIAFYILAVAIAQM